MQIQNIQCPICKGKGKIIAPYQFPYLRIEIDSSKIAEELRKSGYSLREIGKLLGYKNPESVKWLLRKEK